MMRCAGEDGLRVLNEDEDELENIVRPKFARVCGAGAGAKCDDFRRYWLRMSASASAKRA